MLRTGLVLAYGAFTRMIQTLREASRAEYQCRYSARLQRYFNNLTNFEYAETISEWVGQHQNVLVIGDAGGRDSHALSARGKRVVVLDVAPQRDIAQLVRGDISRATPFRAQQFDAVVMAEVIEHLFDDVAALREIRRVLKPSGVFIVTTPIGNDVPDYHVRVYTPKTLVRLLNHTGFKVEKLLLKGGGFARLDGTLLGAGVKHLSQYVVWRLTGKTRYRQWNTRLRRLDCWLSDYAPAVHRWSRHYGMIVLTSPTDEHFDTQQLNIKEFAYRV